MISESTTPSKLAVSMDGACVLALECWRLSRTADLAIDRDEGAALRQGVRRITALLEEMEIKIVDLSGRVYDPGMVPEVVEAREDETLSDGHSVIDETIAPTVMWRSQVVRIGQIIVRRPPGTPSANSKEI